MALKGINAYRKGNIREDISHADPHKLTLMLMQGALDRMAFAKGCMERKDFVGKSEHMARSTAIIINLRDTIDLDVNTEFGENLFALYEYMIQRLTDANIQNDLQIMDEVINLMLPIKNAWAQIPDSAKQEAYEAQRQKRQVV